MTKKELEELKQKDTRAWPGTPDCRPRTCPLVFKKEEEVQRLETAVKAKAKGSAKKTSVTGVVRASDSWGISSLCSAPAPQQASLSVSDFEPLKVPAAAAAEKKPGQETLGLNGRPWRSPCGIAEPLWAFPCAFACFEFCGASGSGSRLPPTCCKRRRPGLALHLATRLLSCAGYEEGQAGHAASPEPGQSQIEQFGSFLRRHFRGAG